MRFTRVVFVVSLLALIVTPVALALRFTDESYNTPIGETGKPYSHQFHGDGGCGPALPYQYRLLPGSSLPPGLSLSKSGLISGVPTQGGTWSFWVELSDQDPSPPGSFCVVPAKAQREFSIKILAGLSIKQNSLTPAGAFLNQPYSSQLTADGGGSQVWSLKSGSLPPGLTLSSSGLISGSPTATGDYTFVIQVSDGNRTDTETYQLSVLEPLKINNAPAASAGEVGLAFQLTPNASGGKQGYTWTLTGTLPAGLTFDPASGAITGRPGAAGTYPIALSVKDAIGLTQTSNVRLVIAPHVLVTKQPLKTARVGKLYAARLLSTGGIRPVTWNILGGRPGILPPGLRLNKRTGVISGIPRQAGLYRLRVQVVDRLGAKSAAGIILKVR